MTDDRYPSNENRDPISNEPGAHPVGTGIGATGGALAGAAAGTLGGPIGVAVGGVAGAVVGGLAGKTAAESVNPTDEEAWWRNNYTREPYYEAGRNYNDYGPAYELGWNHRALHQDNFDHAESRLATDWETQRRGSTLSWSQARAATRAAWDRVDGKLRASTSAIATDKDSDNDDAIDTLNNLIETCRDGEYGFYASAEHASASNLKALFLERAQQCSDAAAELRAQVLRLGGKPEDGGTAGGALHRGWVAVRGTLSGYNDHAILDECERGEDSALGAYRKALKQTLPAALRSLVQRQMEGAQRNHDQIKALRDQAKSRA